LAADDRHVEAQAMTIDVQGAAIEFLTPPQQEPCVMRGTLPARMTVPLHSHADPETFVVLSGHAEALVESRWAHLGTGDVLNVPSGARHGWRNLGDEPVTMILITTAKMGRFFREIAGGSPEHFLATAHRYGYWNATPEETAAAGVPITP
jgi:quercetin dioxygenase-like cupin family protein